MSEAIEKAVGADFFYQANSFISTIIIIDALMLFVGSLQYSAISTYIYI